MCVKSQAEPETATANDRISAMEKIFSPKSVAFIGASNAIGKWGGIVFMNIVMGGFEGKLYPVHPKETMVQGQKAYASVLDIPDEVDLAVFIIPSQAIPEAVSQCVQKGIKAGIVITAGFAELGEEGVALQQDMLARARQGGMVLIGPNCQGIAAPLAKFYPWLPTFHPDPGVIGIASQSGGISTELSERLATLGFGCSKVISAGNCADLSWPDYLDYFRQDPATKVILMYLEGVRDGRAFFEAAKAAAREKPVVILKSGLTEAGSKAASSHTASMAGSGEIFDAVCRQAGISRVTTIDEAAITAAAFINTPLPRGKRIGVLTGGGGHGVLTADAASHQGMELSPLSDDTVKQLQAQLPPWWSPNNPVDMVAGIGYGGPKEIIPILLDSGDYDAVIFNGIGWAYSMIDPVNAPTDLTDPVNKAAFQMQLDEANDLSDALIEYAGKWNIPLLVVSKAIDIAIRRQYEAILKFIDNGLILYPTSEDAVSTHTHLYERYRFLKKEGLAGVIKDDIL